MSKFIKKYKTTQQYLSEIGNLDKPNVSLTEDTLIVHYKRKLPYLRTTALEDGTISFNIWKTMGTNYISSISYSTDGGETWTKTNNTNNKQQNLLITVPVETGDEVLWKGIGTLTGYYDDDDYTAGSFFSSTARFDVDGHIMSLLYGDNFIGKDEINNDYLFACLFYNYDYHDNSVPKVVNTKDLVFPTIVNANYPYLHIFENCRQLISIPNNMTTIGESAFAYCKGLTSVTIPNSVKTIGQYAFQSSGLTSVAIGNSVTSIGDKAFSYCTSLTSVTIPNSVTSIREGAFRNCTSLTSITISNSVTSIGTEAFRDCSSLTSINIPNSVTYIGGYAFYNCTGLTSITIPNSVTSISNNTFYNCNNLTSVTLNSNAIVSKNYSYSSNLKNIFGSQVTEYVIEDNVTSIGSYAFYYCSGLTSITIPNSVTSIGGYAFSGCSGLTSVTIGNNVTSISVSAFSGCQSLTSITIPDNVTFIGESAFASCNSLTSVTIPNNVTSIGSGAFSGCTGLISMIVDDNNIIYDSRNNCNAIIESASNKLICGCKNTIIPNTVTTIGLAFRECNFTSITIPNNIVTIWGQAFEICKNLTSIVIPSSVTLIGFSCFNGCTSLVSATIQATTPPTVSNYYQGGMFSNCTSLQKIYVPASSVDTYKSALGWSTYASLIEAIPE